MEYFWSMFYALMFALALASYFGHQSYELLQEQLESISENQTFIEDLKDQYGAQSESLSLNLKRVLGSDWLFWLIPTYPQVEPNYHEQVWSKQETVEQYKLG